MVYFEPSTSVIMTLNVRPIELLARALQFRLCLGIMEFVEITLRRQVSGHIPSSHVPIMGCLCTLKHSSEGHGQAACRSLALPLDSQQSSHRLENLGPTHFTLSGPNCLTAISITDVLSPLSALYDQSLERRTGGLSQESHVNE